MQPLQYFVPFEELAAVSEYVAYVVLLVVLANMVTRALAHRKHVEQAEDEDADLSRYLPHEATNVLLVLVSFAYLLVHHHGGMVLSILVIGLFLADFFEFEARRVEVRNEMAIEQPKGAIGASLIVFLYAAYQSIFFIVAPVWNAVV